MIEIGNQHNGRKLHLPDDAVTQTIAALGRRGAGKTNTAVVLAEQMLDRKAAIIVLDPIGVWWGLRSSSDGKREGYPVLILGGDHGDKPLDARSGRVAAEFAVNNRVSTILDLSLFGENEMRRFVADFASEFYRINRDPVHLFVDEADEFAPQSGGGGGGREIGRCLGAMQNVVRRGRARGIGVTLITQRSAVLSKSVLSQSEVLIAMQTTSPHDLKAIGDWLEHHERDKTERNHILDLLPKFQRGEALVYSPAWLQGLHRITVNRRKTFDSSATPKAGETRAEPKTLADVNLSAFEGAMADAVKQAENNDPKALRRRIAELERAVAAKPAAEPVTVEVPVLSDESRREIRESAAAIREPTTQLVAALDRVSESLARLNGHHAQRPEIREQSRIRIPDRTSRALNRGSATRADSQVCVKSHGDLTNYQRDLLRVLLDRAPLATPRGQLAALAKKSPRSSAFGPNVRAIIDAGLAEQSDRGFVATDAARLADPDYVPAPSRGPEALAYWIGKLPKQQSAILEYLAGTDAPRTLEQIADNAGYSLTSSAFRPAIRDLCDLSLIERDRDTYAAAEFLL